MIDRLTNSTIAYAVLIRATKRDYFSKRSANMAVADFLSLSRKEKRLVGKNGIHYKARTSRVIDLMLKNKWLLNIADRYCITELGYKVFRDYAIASVRLNPISMFQMKMELGNAQK